MSASLTTRLRRALLWLVPALAVLTVAAWFGGRAWLGQTVMPYSGEIALPGLGVPVEILFDARGIPRVYAETDADALTALGWLHAGERAFQMELIRRMARGRLAALFGTDALELDRFHRRLGFARQAERSLDELDAATRNLLECYVEGINRRLSAFRFPAPEFLLLGHEPRPWTLADVAAVAQYQTWYPSSLANRQSEAYRDLVARFGETAGEMLADTPDWVPPSVPDDLPDNRITRASNTWALAPSRTASGAALHASDPHLDIHLAPGQWYAAGLHVPDGLDVVGVTPPGLPLVAMGHNRVGAWSFTVAPIDLFEYYRETRHAEDPDRVATPNGWARVRRRTEPIEVAGGAGQSVEILHTPRGVVVTDEPGKLVSLHWAGFDFSPHEMLASGLAVMRAGNFETFRRAVTGLGALAGNWMWSDRAGNIGYQLGAPVPRRRHASRFATLDATDPGAGWDGYYSFEQIPAALNPARGWLASSNNPPGRTGPDGEVEIPGFYAFHRINRTHAWLAGRDALTPADMHTMQMDRISNQAMRWKSLMAAAAEDLERPQLAADLRGWNGDMAADSRLAGLFRVWWYHLAGTLFDGVIDDPPRDLRYLRDQVLTRPPESGPLAGLDRLTGAVAALERALATDPDNLGSIQTLTLRHPLARNGLLDLWLDLTRGPFPAGGDAGSLNVSYTRPEGDDRFAVRAGASMRFVMDWSDPDTFTLNLTLGQSGHPLSPHFDDFLPSFIDGTPWTVPASRAAVEARADNRLMLTP